jgi:hypothetical protein
VNCFFFVVGGNNNREFIYRHMVYSIVMCITIGITAKDNRRHNKASG